MSDEKKPKVVLNTPSNLKPEDLGRLLSTDSPKYYNFLGHEVNFFANDAFVGIHIKWAAEGFGWGGVTLSCCIKDDGTFWANKGQWHCDTEMMSPQFVAALLRHVSNDLAAKMDDDTLMNKSSIE